MWCTAPICLSPVRRNGELQWLWLYKRQSHYKLQYNCQASCSLWSGCTTCFFFIAIKPPKLMCVTIYLSFCSSPLKSCFSFALTLFCSLSLELHIIPKPTIQLCTHACLLTREWIISFVHTILIVLFFSLIHLKRPVSWRKLSKQDQKVNTNSKLSSVQWRLYWSLLYLSNITAHSPWILNSLILGRSHLYFRWGGVFPLYITLRTLYVLFLNWVKIYFTALPHCWILNIWAKAFNCNY